jgi:hypothetical protein
MQVASFATFEPMSRAWRGRCKISKNTATGSVANQDGVFRCHSRRNVLSPLISLYQTGLRQAGIRRPIGGAKPFGMSVSPQ